MVVATEEATEDTVEATVTADTAVVTANTVEVTVDTAEATADTAEVTVDTAVDMADTTDKKCRVCLWSAKTSFKLCNLITLKCPYLGDVGFGMKRLLSTRNKMDRQENIVFNAGRSSLDCDKKMHVAAGLSKAGEKLA